MDDLKNGFLVDFHWWQLLLFAMIALLIIAGFSRVKITREKKIIIKRKSELFVFLSVMFSAIFIVVFFFESGNDLINLFLERFDRHLVLALVFIAAFFIVVPVLMSFVFCFIAEASSWMREGYLREKMRDGHLNGKKRPRN